MNESLEPNSSNKIALLAIDVQQGLFERPKPIYQAEAFLANLQTLIERARQAGAPVIFIQHANDKLLKPDTPAWQLHPAIQPLDGEVIIHKRHGNAFEGTGLHERLADSGVRTVVITGLVTHGCIRATCTGALDLGYRAVLVSDGHSHYSPKPAAIIEEWNHKLHALGAELVETGEVDFEGL